MQQQKGVNETTKTWITFQSSTEKKGNLKSMYCEFIHKSLFWKNVFLLHHREIDFYQVVHNWVLYIQWSHNYSFTSEHFPTAIFPTTQQSILGWQNGWAGAWLPGSHEEIERSEHRFTCQGLWGNRNRMYLDCYQCRHPGLEYKSFAKSLRSWE